MTETPEPAPQSPASPPNRPRLDIRRMLGVTAIIAAILIYFFWDDIHDILRPAHPVRCNIPAEALADANEIRVSAGPITATFSRIGAVITGLTWTSPADRHEETLIGQDTVPNQAFLLALPDPGNATDTRGDQTAAAWKPLDGPFDVSGPDDITETRGDQSITWKQLRFTTTSPAGARIEKVFRICSSNRPANVAPVELEIIIKNPPDAATEKTNSLPQKKGYQLLLANAIGTPSELKKDDGLITVRSDGATVQVPIRRIRELQLWPATDDKLRAGHGYPAPVTLQWAAISDRHFSLLVHPKAPIKGAQMVFLRTSGTTAAVQLQIPPDEMPSVKDTYQIYTGPKDYNTLAELPDSQQEVINYWYLGRPVTQFLKFVHDRIVPNYGLAIILVTIVFRLLMWPITSYNLRAMVDIKLANAKLKELDANEPPRSEPAVRAAWLKEVRPWEDMQRKATIGVFLPMVILLPTLLVLYYALQVGYEFWRQPFVLWITDISRRDPIFLLPVLMGLAMMGQLRTMAQDPKKDKSWLVMSIGLTILFSFFSAGVVLFWITDTLVGWLQLIIIKKSHRPKPAAVPDHADG